MTHKDRAARIWCENATLLTGTAWNYGKVPQGDFERLRPADLADLRLAFGGGSPWIRTWLVEHEAAHDEQMVQSLVDPESHCHVTCRGLTWRAPTKAGEPLG